MRGREKRGRRGVRMRENKGGGGAIQKRRDERRKGGQGGGQEEGLGREGKKEKIK